MNSAQAPSSIVGRRERRSYLNSLSRRSLWHLWPGDSSILHLRKPRNRSSHRSRRPNFHPANRVYCSSRPSPSQSVHYHVRPIREPRPPLQAPDTVPGAFVSGTPDPSRANWHRGEHAATALNTWASSPSAERDPACITAAGFLFCVLAD